MSEARDNELVKILGRIQIFQGMEDHELALIVPLLEPVTYPPGTLIIEEGSRGDSMFIIKSGTVNVSKSEEKEDKVNLGNLYSGSYFGELSLIDNLPRSADVKSLEETEIYRLNKTDFDKLLSNNMRIANIFYRNCLNETFYRFRNVISSLTFSQHILNEKSAKLTEIDKDLTSAKEIQDFFINTKRLNSNKIFSGGIKHSYIYHPCLAIGGDFLNIVKLDENAAAVIIADFTGHGIAAALGTGVLKSVFSLAVKQLGKEPVRLLNFFNKHFIKIINQLYATCYYAVVDPNNMKITFAKAGHHHPLFWKKSLNDFINIQSTGVGLGMVPDAEFNEARYDIEKGDKILFFTDGIIEQVNKNNRMYSIKRLEYIFRELINRGEENILDNVLKDINEFTHGMAYDDDITLFLLEI